MQTRYLVVGILLVGFIGPACMAQRLLPTWQTKDKKATHEGEFYLLDDKYLTILAPRKIAVDALSRDAIRQAHSMEAANFKAGPPQPFTIIEVPPPMNVWKTNDGKSAEGAFHYLDETEGKLVLLFPREIELSRLTPDSIELAKQLEIGDRPQKELIEWREGFAAKHVKNLASLEEKVQQAIKSAEDEKNRIRQEATHGFASTMPASEVTIGQWKALNRRDKILFVANWIYVFNMKGGVLTQDARSAIPNLQSLNRYAEVVTEGLEEIIASVSNDQLVRNHLATYMQTLGMLRQIIVADKYVFTDLKYITEGTRTYLLGKVTNSGSDEDIASFNINFEKKGELKSLTRYSVFNFKKSETKTFKEMLDVANPDDYELSITIR